MGELRWRRARGDDATAISNRTDLSVEEVQALETELRLE